MQKLSDLDSLFLYLDTENAPMHIGCLSIYDSSNTDIEGKGFKDVLAYYRACQGNAKYFRRKLAHVPLNIGNPYWVDDEDFEIEYHVRHVALPRPGDWRQLSILVGRLFSLPLDMSRPLWDVYVIEGLDNIKGLPKGCFALLHKMHHCVIDEASSINILDATHTRVPEFELPEQKEFKAERDPSNVYLYYKGLQQQLNIPRYYVNYGKRYYHRIQRAANWLKKTERHLQAAPVSRFNHPVSSNRIFAGIEFDLAELQRIQEAVPDVSLDDVVSSICGGGLRQYLMKDGDNLQKSLVALIPKSIRAEQGLEAAGNQISILRVVIGSQIADHVERLKAVSKSRGDAHKLSDILGQEIVTETVGLFNPLSAKIAASLVNSKVNEMVSMFNTVIAEVEGPDEALYFMGCKMVGLYGMGPPAAGLGLFQVALTYNDTLTLGISCCREMMPDPGVYIKTLQNTFAELKLQLGIV